MALVVLHFIIIKVAYKYLIDFIFKQKKSPNYSYHPNIHCSHLALFYSTIIDGINQCDFEWSYALFIKLPNLKDAVSPIYGLLRK